MLWLAVIRDAGGWAHGSSNQCEIAHRRAQLCRLGEMYLDCVHSAKISRSPDWVTSSPNSPVVSSYCVFLLTLNGSDCNKRRCLFRRAGLCLMWGIDEVPTGCVR